MIIWKIRIAIDKMKIIIRLFDYSIDFRIIEYLMPKYGHMRQYTHNGAASFLADKAAKAFAAQRQHEDRRTHTLPGEDYFARL